MADSGSGESAGRPRFYYVSEAAKELRRSEKAVRWMIHTGQIRTGKILGRTVISPAEIDRLIEGAFSEE